MSKRAFGSRAAESKGPSYATTRSTFQVAEDIMPIAELKVRLSETVRGLDTRPRPLVITLNGKPAAVLMSPREFDRLRDREQVMVGLSEGLADDAAGRVVGDDELGRLLEQELAARRPHKKPRR